MISKNSGRRFVYILIDVENSAQGFVDEVVQALDAGRLNKADWRIYICCRKSHELPSMKKRKNSKTVRIERSASDKREAADNVLIGKLFLLRSALKSLAKEVIIVSGGDKRYEAAVEEGRSWGLEIRLHDYQANTVSSPFQAILDQYPAAPVLAPATATPNQTTTKIIATKTVATKKPAAMQKEEREEWVRGAAPLSYPMECPICLGDLSKSNKLAKHVKREHNDMDVVGCRICDVCVLSCDFAVHWQGCQGKGLKNAAAQG